MMRWNDFTRSLLFGAVAAAAFVPFAMVAAPLLGWSGALAAYAVVSASAYLAGLGASRRQVRRVQDQPTARTFLQERLHLFLRFNF